MTFPFHNANYLVVIVEISRGAVYQVVNYVFTSYEDAIKERDKLFPKNYTDKFLRSFESGAEAQKFINSGNYQIIKPVTKIIGEE